MLVSQILNSKASETVLTISGAASVAEAAAVLSARKIGCLVVSTDGVRPDGILSERDIVREVGKTGATCLTRQVDSLMTRNLVTCAKGDSADLVLQKMTDGRFRHMPVVDGGRLVGLISIGDVVKARLAELAMEKDALEGMIKGF